jgi:CopG family nickel-responsive transcriptional regulator
MASILSVSIDPDSERSLALLQERFGFRNRSETVRAAIRELGGELQAIESLRQPTTAVALIVHDDTQEEALHRLKHDFNDIVATQMHNSFSHSCIEIFVLNGPGSRIAVFAKELKKNPKFRRAELLLP